MTTGANKSIQYIGKFKNENYFWDSTMKCFKFYVNWYEGIASLSQILGILQSTVNDIVNKWVNHMSHIRSQLHWWTTKHLIVENITKYFTDFGYQETRCIIIGSVQTMALLKFSVADSYFQRLNNHTAKRLNAVAPHSPIYAPVRRFCDRPYYKWLLITQTYRT